MLDDHYELNESHRPCKGMKIFSEDTLLYELKHNINMMNQFDVEGTDYSYRHHAMNYLVIIEYLLSKLEIMECGSYGGFAKEQIDRSLTGRILWQIERLT